MCREYISEIRRSKMTSWRDFVSIKGNAHPWELVYEILRNKIRHDFNSLHALEERNGHTVTWKDTATKLMNKMVPVDDNLDDADRRITKDEIKAYLNYNLEPLISEDEVDSTIKKMRNNKAPGLDGFNPEIIKQTWRLDREVVLILLNNCLRQSAFPEPWKQAKLKPILKDIQKDPAKVNSYRPIALLSVLAKLFERIVVNRIQSLYIEGNLESNLQFGFKPGRGTDDALRRIITTIRNCDSKYAVTIFFDIVGAFDNLWWPAVLRKVMKTNCSSQLFNILQDYFNKRLMILTSSHDRVAKEMTKGCYKVPSSAFWRGTDVWTSFSTNLKCWRQEGSPRQRTQMIWH